jgi:two-component system cell cycle response regulator DivK
MTKNKKILYVEDAYENRVLIRRILEAEGYIVLEAENAHNALKVIDAETPDLILMDINMPEMDGYTLTNRLRMRPALENTPILALTANVLRGDRERTLKAGCDGYIQKPIDVDTFSDHIGQYLER